MYLFSRWIISLAVITISSSTDLVAVYKHDVLLLRDVDKTPADTTPMSWESHTLDVPQPFSYPVGLTYDPQGRRLFVAEAMHEDSKIFSLNLDANYTVKQMQSVVKTTNTTVMEDLTYDPRTGHLYWTDSFNHGVYKTWVPIEQKENPTSHPEPAHVFSNVIEPRGIAIDYCNELMYWTERDGSGNVPSSIEVCDLDGPSHTIIQQGGEHENKIFYQGLTYDIKGGKLLWAETVGDDFEESFCRIVSYEFGQSLPKQEVLVNLENCYPFSLTTDKDYIYWADWGQQGIMRASRTNPNDVVKLVHTPQINSKYGEHHGVYGLAILDSFTDDTIQEACKGKSFLQKKLTKQESEMPVDDNPLESEVNLKNKQKPDDHVSSEKYLIPNPSEDDRTKSKTQNHKDSDTIGSETESSHHTGEENSYPNDEGSLSLGNEDVVQVSSNPVQSLMMQTHMCSENQLLVVVVVLAFFCMLFMLTTLILVFKIWGQRRPNGCKGEILPTTISDKAVEVQPRQRKRFGPKVKPVLNGALTCPTGSGNDGVSINIEDCCQMTLCDTPCYTTVKKEGRGYKSTLANHNSKTDDKRGLLDDMDDLSNF